ncbi:MAG: hypothetical protein L0323_20560 [Planctomycetes bacterium]|nr:hypothetical protein [Planctomycetota bacterium]
MIPAPVVGFLLLQTTWVVDDSGGPGVDFTDIPPAIAAASDGDALLVGPGTYSHFVLIGKSLRILGSGNQSTFVTLPGAAGYTTEISDVPAGHVVDLRRMNFGWTFGATGGDRLVVTGSSTQAVLADSIVIGRGNPSFFGPAPFSALRVVDAGVQVHRSILASEFLANGLLPLPDPSGGIALTITGGARVLVSTSSVLGGWGQFLAGVLYPPVGGPAIVATEGPGGSPWLWVTDSIVEGGRGGVDQGFASFTYGAAGAGIVATNAHVRVSGDAASLTKGGYGQPDAPGIVASGTDPVQVHSVPVQGGTPATPPIVGNVIVDVPSLPVLRASGSFALSGVGTLTLSNGPASAPFVLVLDEGPSHFGIPGPFLGEFVIGPPPSLLFHFGTLGPTGSASLTIPLSGLPPSLANMPFHVQGAALDAGGVWRLSNGTVVFLEP